MASCFQAAALVASPLYPNAIAWSQENLIAVASGHLVTILNPALPFGPRGLITIPSSEPFRIGVIKREELLTGPLLPICLNRDPRPCVRSLSWSDIGMAPNSGCLLAICSAEGRVKLYRPPYHDFCADWVQVMDITDMLSNYLSTISFRKLATPSSGVSNKQAKEHDQLDEDSISVSRRESKRRRLTINKCSSTYQEYSSDCENNNDNDAVFSPSSEMEGQRVPEAFEIKSEKNSRKKASVSKTERNTVNKIAEDCSLPLITTDQYASRNATLSSVVVSWSPVLRVSSKTCQLAQHDSSNRFCLLAVGAKSGQISLWRIHAPECYYIEHSNSSMSAILIGLLQAHTSWVTTVSWGLLDAECSNPQVLLATGSSDGSVRIWLGYGEDLRKLSEVDDSPVFLLKEMITVNTVPVSVLSLIMPIHHSNQRMLLAIGKFSGSFEVWTCDISSQKFERTGSCNAHDQVVTGLAWAFDGCCLYSCSQDNFVRSWILHEGSLSEVPIPSNTPGLRSGTDLPDVYFSCLGVAFSPGNLVVAMVRSFNVDLLDQMYQARSQKAAVEFFWTGAQKLNVLSNNSLEISIEASGFSEKELVYWESNFLWSLKQFDHADKPLVVWDIVASLLAFKRSIPEYVEYLVLKWLGISYLGSHIGLSTEKIIANVSRSVPKATSRQLHILNVITRCVMLSELKADQINSNIQNLRAIHDAEDKHLMLWLELLLRSERELRERLVGFTFFSSLNLASHSATKFHLGHWYPFGLSQMEKWVALNHDWMRDELKALASELKTQQKRQELDEYTAEEKCCYCSASVPFVSAEVAVCNGLGSKNGGDQKHKLERCAVSMQVCPTAPLWFCKCCHRWTSKLAPEILFMMSRYPSDFKSLTDISVLKETTKPLCPFCGILLQRSQPDFLLSASPV